MIFMKIMSLTVVKFVLRISFDRTFVFIVSLTYQTFVDVLRVSNVSGGEKGGESS